MRSGRLASFAPTSMPRVGSSKNSTLALPQQPLADDDLLLVAAGKQPHPWLLGRRPDRQPVDIIVGRLVSGESSMRMPPGPATRDMLAIVMLLRTPISTASPMLAIFREIADAGRHRVLGERIQVFLPRMKTAGLNLVGAEDGARHLRPTGPHQPGKPNTRPGGA